MDSVLELIKAKQRDLAECFQQFPEIACVYVFGSQVTGQVHDQSDIDFALLLKDGDIQDTSMLEYQAEKILGFVAPVEITILNHQDVFFQQSVLEQGKILCSFDENRRIFFEMDVMKCHAELEPHWQFLEPFIERGIRRRLHRASG